MFFLVNAVALSDKEYLQINQALFSLTHAYSARMERENREAETGLGLSDRAVIMLVGQFEPLHARRLSELMDLNAGTVSEYVHRVVKEGLVQKRQDDADRRIWWLTLTPKGKAAFRETVDGTVSYTRDFLIALDDGERRVLHTLLLKASRGLGVEWL